MHSKISYEIYSEAGTYHKQHGIENQDAIKVGMKDDYFFCAISDGCGSSKYAKQAAEVVVEVSTDFCYDLVLKNNKIESLKELPYVLQLELQNKSQILNLDFNELKSTLVLFVLNLKTKRYYIAHIGDGIVICGDQVLSYPENGMTSQFTYFANQEDVLKHFRINTGILKNQSVLISTDGLFDNCYNTNDYIKRFNRNRAIKMRDDMSYCKLQFS
ncbi:protein phosphatase 2C domain-containing protein [uncultured Eubacterium sp.]|uniref:protein phosphatase 2C domain-containing protein n=1 Tax=uncultured Eubacterium sp. TaxID=165185 RepID=UPI0025DA4788|nr:protein phosphatase 2C domain-containing protein [uncultured Eubacterium sp.]